MNDFHLYSFIIGFGLATAVGAIVFIFGKDFLFTKTNTITRTITETVEKLVYKDREPTVDESVELIKKAGREDLLFKAFTLTDAYEMLRAQKKHLQLDRTKRNSLQPGSQPLVPHEFDEIVNADQQQMRDKIAELQKAEREMYVPSTYHADLEHKFYGTSVTIGRWSRAGLEKRLHILEITQNQLFIDQQPQPINPSDLEHIKQVLQHSKTVEANG